MKVKACLQNVADQLKGLNTLNKNPNNFLHFKKNGDLIDVILDINGVKVAQVKNVFGSLFSYRDEYMGVYHENSGELEIFTSAALHQHTEYSILDGANRVKALAKKNEYAGAITDHGVMYGVIDFFKKMTELHKHPIIGFEAYCESLDGSGAKEHLIILCKNQKGYENAVKLCTEAQQNYGGKFPQRPLVTYANLQKYSEGLVVLSACLAGAIPQAIIKEDDTNLEKALDFFMDTFGEDFYLEIQRHASLVKMQEEADKVNQELGLAYTVEEYKEQFMQMGKKAFKASYSKKLMEEVQLAVQEEAVNARIVKIAKQYAIKLVATTDAHYLNPDDEEMHEALLCNQVKQTMNNPERWQFAGNGYHVHTQSELETLFQDMPEAVINTLEVADKCKFKFVFGQYKLPKFEVPEGFDQIEYLRKLAWDGFHERFDGTGNENNAEYIKQLEFELETIKNTGYAGYFLIVWDYVRWAKEHGIAVGPGRGSGAGSLVLYCLHITEALDPLKFGLLFEREKECVH